jgi:arsenate reductase
MTEPYNVLFLCTGNSARSILAECILNRLGKDRFRAYSAGSHPTGRVNPLALELLAELGFETRGLRSKSWNEFASADAPHLDFVFTVCNAPASEVCPLWPGQPLTANWGIEDPAAAEGSEEKRRHAFRRAWFELETRIRLFLSLPIGSLDRMRLQTELEAIGKISPRR